MQIQRKNRSSNRRSLTKRRTTSRQNFLRLERLEDRLALATAPVAINDFYHDLVNQPLEISSPGILANDTSGSGGALAAGLFSGPAHGTLEMDDDGSFIYMPEADYMGLDSFLYFANDGAGDSMLAAVTISVGEGGPPPDAIDDVFTLDEDGMLGVALSDGVLANDIVADGQSLAAALVAGPSNGTLTLGEDGSLTYVPNANFSGTDSFTYRATDDAGDSDLATATITVNAVNDKPTAANNAYSMSEDGSLTVDAVGGLLTNDGDIDGDTLVPSITSQPLHGTVTMNDDGSFSYTPEANYNGLDGFSYLVSDGTTTSDVASATITIGAVNDQPVGVNDEYTTAEDTVLEVAAPGVLVNDADIDGDALSTILVNPPQHGTMTLGGDGALLYTPNANFNGVDGFSYLANDASADSEATAVTINVTPVNDAPATAADAYTTDEDVPLSIDAAAGVLANDSDVDGDAMSVAIVSGPTSGSLTLNADGSFNYAPNANFNGSDSFIYTASDGTLASGPTTVTIGVTPVNDAPTAAGDSYSLDEDTTLTVDAAAGVLANDGDIDGDALSASVVSGPSNGSLTMNADGSFSYAPNAGFNGTDSFVYRASDGSLSADATVALTINAVADAPLPAIDNYSTGEDVPLVVNATMGVLANDISVEGGEMTAAVVTGPAHGALTMNADGSFSYTPEANYHGNDSFTYKAVESGLEVVSSANIVVEPLNDAPAAVNDEVAIVAGQPSAANVLDNDTDIDGNSLVSNLVSGPAHGALTLNADGTFNYTPAAGFTGDDSFRYQAFDGMANSNVATVTLHVAGGPAEVPPPATNQRPLAVNDVFSTEADTTLNVPIATGLLTNDSDPEGSPITASLFANPLHGNISLASDGSFNYTPTSGYVGLDAFLYRVSDGALWSSLAAVTIHVTPADEPDEAPVPTPTPTPQPDPCEPVICCHHGHGNKHESHAAKAQAKLAKSGGNGFAAAVDEIFGRHRGWRS